MTNEEILKKALLKATYNGMPASISAMNKTMNELIEEDTYYSLIFSHSFAKAFWGEELLYVDDDPGTGEYPKTYGPIAWQFHLQQMVLEEDPIKYLEKFI